jgi:chorismate dehydratase
MKLGYIDYLNCYPFYYRLFEKENLDGVSVLPAYPSVLNASIARGELDMSPISSAAFPDIQNEAYLLRDFCLSSVGYVRSVVLASNVPIEDLQGKTVGLSSASQTSVILLKILLRKYYGITPMYVSSPPLPDLSNIDAALVIGNEAMTDVISKGKFMYDIGELWLIKTGYPVVFAVFALRTDALSAKKSFVNAIIASFHASLRCLETEREALIEGASARYPNINASYIDEYYGLLKFTFTAELQNALAFYYTLAAAEGLLKPVERIRWYPA